MSYQVVDMRTLNLIQAVVKMVLSFKIMKLFSLNFNLIVVVG